MVFLPPKLSHANPLRRRLARALRPLLFGFQPYRPSSPLNRPRSMTASTSATTLDVATIPYPTGLDVVRSADQVSVERAHSRVFGVATTRSPFGAPLAAPTGQSEDTEGEDEQVSLGLLDLPQETQGQSSRDSERASSRSYQQRAVVGEELNDAEFAPSRWPC